MNPASGHPKILIVEDESSIADTILFPLESDGCQVECCATGGAALERMNQEKFDLVVLDVGLPDLSGFEVCRRIRQHSDVPILFLTARSEEIDRVVGLEIGGDDYVLKPFRPRELSARIRAILRRARDQISLPTHGERNRPAPAAFTIDHHRKLIFFFGVPLELSRYEFRLLETLSRSPGRVFSRAQLMEAGWEEPEASMARTVDAHIKTLRSKLRCIRPDVDAIQTHRGFGYSLSEKM